MKGQELEIEAVREALAGQEVQSSSPASEWVSSCFLCLFPLYQPWIYFVKCFPFFDTAMFRDTETVIPVQPLSQREVAVEFFHKEAQESRM